METVNEAAEISDIKRFCSEYLVVNNDKKLIKSEDEIANVNFLYDDIVQALQNTIDYPPEIDAVMCWNEGLPKSMK